MNSPKRHLKALIVDDSADDTQLMVREFERGGFTITHQRVETADGLKDALDHEKWDVLLSDYTMPQFSGISALQIAREHGPDMPFLFVSGTMGEEVAVEAMKAGADDYIMKSSLRRLAPAVEREMREAERRREHEDLKRIVTIEREQAFVKVKNANAALQQFAYLASHDLQEPLRAVSGCVKLLQRRYSGKLDQQAEPLIQMIVDGSARMKDMIVGLLAFSVADQNANLETIETGSALEQALAQLSSVIQESEAQIVAAELPSLRFAKVQFVQVLQNLVGNAIKYRSEAAPRINISAHHEEGAWVFRVEDNGIGFESEYAEKVFDIFGRLHTSEAYPGSGIGLALVKRVVELRGGKVWAESTPGRGSTFFFSVPDRTDAEDGK
jgi:light-regulated signal transduction histidine kinase (bacteriophytochrome)